MKPVLNSKQKKDFIQPLGKDGYMNEEFNRVYGKDKNPYSGTERDKSVSRGQIHSRTGLTRDKGKEVERREKINRGRYDF
jgi:hypothetical protein